MALALFLSIYVACYLNLRIFFTEPAANLQYFAYRGSEEMDRACYYAFWPLYKIERSFTGRRHNLDRIIPFVIPEE